MDEAVQYSGKAGHRSPARYVAAGARTADFLSRYYAAKLICSAAALRHLHDFLKLEIIYCGSHRFCASSCTFPCLPYCRRSGRFDALHPGRAGHVFSAQAPCRRRRLTRAGRLMAPCPRRLPAPAAPFHLFTIISSSSPNSLSVCL